MNNFEKYTALHNEVMKRLEDGDITTEQAKEVIDLSFDKYVTESVNIQSIKDAIKKLGNWIANALAKCREIHDEHKRLKIQKKIDTLTSKFKKLSNKDFKTETETFRIEMELIERERKEIDAALKNANMSTSSAAQYFTNLKSHEQFLNSEIQRLKQENKTKK
jgi:chromosome segregation ATPase